jgi:hypothetical protein
MAPREGIEPSTHGSKPCVHPLYIRGIKTSIRTARRTNQGDSPLKRFFGI